jgi:cyanamide hydratase
MNRELLDSAVERDIDRLLHSLNIHAPQHFSLSSVEIPTSKLAEEAVKFVRSEVELPIFNHSYRAYVLGNIVQRDQFSHWHVDMEQYFLSCMFHDVGLGPNYHLNTPMSFEFQGAIVANNFITKHGGTKDAADRVFEACANHTIENQGKINAMGKLIQISTSIDVSGKYPQLCHPNSISEIYKEWPLHDFHNCFADKMELEVKHKPGCLTSESGPGYSARIRKTDHCKIFNLDTI